ncbi:efflux RND transporter periplasmic adaptor subunit [bacterium]|nr:efflux RND transporter periplasmic adaptor subunit [bacterium]
MDHCIRRIIFPLVAVILLSPALWASGEHEAAEAEHGHGEEEGKTAAITVWENGYEIFLEHPYLTLDHPATFITHVSSLETGQPRRDGPVTFELRQGDAPPIPHVVEQPAREGIYLPELTFPKVGEWQVTLVIPEGGKEYRVPLPVMQVYPNHAAVEAAPEPEEVEGIGFLKEQQWKIPTLTRPAARREIVRRMRLPATVVAPPHSQAAVTPPVGGTILAGSGERLPRVGEMVQKGQRLARIQPPVAGADYLSVYSNRLQLHTMEVDLQVKRAEAEAEARRARVALEQAGAAHKRVSELAGQNLKSQRELEEALYAKRKAEADVAAAELLQKAYREAETALRQSDGETPVAEGFPMMDLVAPISGMILEVNAVLGEHVSASEPAFRILDPSTVFIRAHVAEADIHEFEQSAAAIYELQQRPGEFHTILNGNGGHVVQIGPVVDPRTRTMPIIYELPNPDNSLRPGMALNVFIETGHVENALVIPESAVVEEDTRPVAFVQVSGETFQKRDLVLGFSDRGWVQVQSGITEGEQVVVEGAYVVRLASVSTSIPAHGHAH